MGSSVLVQADGVANTLELGDTAVKISTLKRYASWGVLATGCGGAYYMLPFFRNIVKKYKKYLIIYPIDKFVSVLESHHRIVRSKQRFENFLKGMPSDYNLSYPEDSEELSTRYKKMVALGIPALLVTSLLMGSAVIVYPPLLPYAAKSCSDTLRAYAVMRTAKGLVWVTKIGIGKKVTGFLFNKPSVPKRPEGDF